MQPEPTIASDTHATEPVQTADPQPGHYFVSVVNGSKHAALLGLFPEHQQALDWVVACREYVNAHDLWSHFYSFGTCRLPLETARAKLPPGKLNAVFPQAPGLNMNHKQESEA